jgi:hypothetical protein
VGRPEPVAAAKLRAALVALPKYLADHAPVDAEFLTGVARGLDEAHLQHDLLRRAHDEIVDDVGSVLPREPDRLCGRGRVRHLAREDRAAVGGRHAGGRSGRNAVHVGCDARGVVADLDVDDPDELLGAVIDRHVGGADLLAENVEGAIGQRHHVRDLDVADDEVDEAAIGLKRVRLADGRPHGADPALPDLDHFDLGAHRREGARGNEHDARERRRDREDPRPAREAPAPAARVSERPFRVMYHSAGPRPVLVAIRSLAASLAENRNAVFLSLHGARDPHRHASRAVVQRREGCVRQRHDVGPRGP